MGNRSVVDELNLVRGLLEGRVPEGVDPEEMGEPWRSILLHLGPGATRGEVEALLRQLMAGNRKGEETAARMANALMGRESETESKLRSLREMSTELQPVEWLWPGWLPRGLLSLLGAAPGAGKSLVALDLARRVIEGLPWPDGAPAWTGGEARGGGVTQCGGGVTQRGTVLYVDAEATPEVLRSRAEAWDMDTGRLYALLPPGSWEALDLGQRRHKDHLLRVVAWMRPELVIVDSLSSITSKGENSVDQVRGLMGFLAAVARGHHTAVLLIHHLRKPVQTGGEASRPWKMVGIQDFRGSGHITAIPRTVLAMSVVHTGPEPDPNGPRRLEVIKSNLGACPPALGVRLEPGTGEVPVVVYGPPPVAYRPPTQIEACAEWLVGLLRAADQPLRPQDVVAAGAEVGFKRWVVYQARQRLEGVVVDTENRHAARNCWRMGRAAAAAPYLQEQPAQVLRR